MQRYLTLCLLLLMTIPVGLSIQGCANKNSNYCNGAGYGYTKSQPVAITLQPQATGLSVAYGQQAQLSAPTAQTCTGSTATISSYTYGTTNRTIADVSPTGEVCGGTWNLNTPGVANYTTCLPTDIQGVAYMTASGSGFTSNQVAVYSHPPISSLTIATPTNTSGQIECLSQGQTTQLDASAYCASTGPATSTATGTTGAPPGTGTPGTGTTVSSACPSSTVTAGQPVLICSPSYSVTSSGTTYGATDCNNIIGHIDYTASNASVVTIDDANGVATAQTSGSTLINGLLSNTGAASGYFYTCPPKSIALSNSSTGGTTLSLTPNTPAPLTATVIDVNGNTINGLDLSYVSSNPQSISVSSTGSVTASYPSTSALSAVCEPSSCNPAPINLIGSLGTGAPVVSNLVQATSPGQNSTYVWTASPSSQYFVETDLSTGTVGTPNKLPYTPNSMVMNATGTTLYFGSYNELMVVTASTNTLTSQLTNLPGVVLAVSPTNTMVVVNDRNRGVLYVYTPSTSAISSYGGVAQSAYFSPDGQTVYMVGTNTLYVYNTYTGWSSESLPTNQATNTTGVCPANNSTTYPENPNSNPPNDPSNPNNSYNMFCSPGVALTVPTVAAFLSGTQTSAYSFCPNTSGSTPVYYPEATTVNAATDQVAATTNGTHIIGATANPAELSDISITVPIGACPTTSATTPTNGTIQTVGNTFTPAPTVLQASLSGYGITNIDQVVASTSSTQVFITYLSNAASTPAGGALLPEYSPSSQTGVLGTLTPVKLAGSAIDPISGIFSPDNTIFFVGTTGDNQIHEISTSTLTDTTQFNPKLTDQNGNAVPPVFLAVAPRPTT